MAEAFRIGVISDTHGLLRPEVLPQLEGSDHILHLGDVGDPEILGILARIAPVTAIRGNVDTHGPCAQLPATEVATLAGHDFYMLHNVHELDLDPAAAGFSAVLYGHSHKPEIRRHKGVLYLNPGSCGPRRFQLPISCARITVNSDGQLEAKILELPIP
jgi:uncharacterized protein